MRRFASSYRALPAFGLLVIAVGAFVIGTTIPSRFDTDTGLDPAEIPSSALAGGLDTLVGVLVFTAFGYLVRFAAYALFDSVAAPRRPVWVALAALEVIYVAFSLFIAWGATEPVVDAGFLWIPFIGLATIVTVASVITLIVAVVVRSRAKARR